MYEKKKHCHKKELIPKWSNKDTFIIENFYFYIQILVEKNELTENDKSDSCSLKGDNNESKWWVSTQPSFPSSDSTIFSWISQSSN